MKIGDNIGVVLDPFLTSLANDKRLAMAAKKQYQNFVDSLLRNHGAIVTIKICKDINSSYRHWVVGYPQVKSKFGGTLWLKVNKQTGTPKRLNLLTDFIEKEPKVGLSIPNVVYLWETSVIKDVSTLEKPYTGTLSEEASQDFKDFLRWNCPKLKPKRDVPVTITCKGGPNGPSAVSQAQDMVALLLTLGDNFRRMIKQVYGPDSWFMDMFNNFSKEVIETEENIHFKQTPILAKVIFIPGPAGKTRTVFVLNWWIQQLLLPLHEALYEHFRVMDNDCTWDQAKGVEAIRVASAKGLEMFSFDLSAATDRWPLWHQSLVMGALFSDDIAKTWAYLSRWVVPYCPDLGRYVNYVVGQPMGAYASWAMLNMSHHMVLRYLCQKQGIMGSYPYAVLGDDVVIWNSEVASSYVTYMTSLGVEINKAKSIINEKGKPSSAEFARHLVKDGKLVGTISPGLLKEVYQEGRIFLQVELVREIRTKFSLEIFVSPQLSLIPKSLGSFLIAKDKLVTILSLQHPSIKLPVTYVTSKEALELAKSEEYLVFENPWKGTTDPQATNAILMTQWMKEGEATLNELNHLDTALAAGKDGACKGFLLSSVHHPLRSLTKFVKDDLSKVMWALMGGNRKLLLDRYIDTDISLLIKVLTEGVTYRKWRDTKSLRVSKLSNSILKCHKRAVKALKRASMPT